MTKLKALRGAVGAYGRVSAGGIIDVDESKVAALLKTKRFTRANEQDIEAAQLAQKRALSSVTPGAGPGFMPIPESRSSADRLSELVERGEISRDKAKELGALEISLSTEEVQAFIKKEVNEIAAQFDAAQAELAARAQRLDKREHDLAEREKALEALETKVGDDNVANVEAASKSNQSASDDTMSTEDDQASAKGKKSGK